MKLVEYPDREILMLDLANRLSGELADYLRRNDSATLCVPGGTTPGPIFDVLSEQALDWDRVAVVLNDERWVDEDNPRSNAALLRQKLLISKASEATFIPFYQAGLDPDSAAVAAAKALEPHLPISVLLLGMGADMHTASLFPRAVGTADALRPDAPAVCVTRPADQPEPRVTLSAQALDAAMSKHLVITGSEKRAALERARGMDPIDAPIAAVLADTTVHWAE